MNARLPSDITVVVDVPETAGVGAGVGTLEVDAVGAETTVVPETFAKAPPLRLRQP